MKVMFYLFVFLSMAVSLVALSLSYELYYMSHQGISAYASGTGELNLTVEASTATCGDSICNGAETCSSCDSDCGACASAGSGSSGGGSSGGGAAATSSTPRFSLDQSNINIQIVSGTSQSNELIVENTGSIPITLSVVSSGIDQYVIFKDKELILAPGEKKSLIFTINAPEPGIYAGKIILTYRDISREALILVNVVSEGVLFDATVTIPDLYRVLRANQRLPVLIELTEVGNGKGVDVTMNYIIKDFNNDIKYTESETFYVEGTKSYSKRFSTNGLEPGDYVLGAELVYPGGFATSSAHFKISETVLTLQTWIGIVVFFIAIMVVIFSIIFFRRKQNYAPMIRRRNKI
ncbi:MAG: hypothetical protein ACP5NS_00020 [Candidatus Pacearchaeota archaeon]